MSLENLLSSAFDVDRKRSLILALKLAASVLQLHNTPWLDENWGKQHIQFLLHRDSQGDALVESAFVSRKINSSEPRPLQPLSEPVVSLGTRNRCLFSLGIVLIELWFGKTLKSLRGGNNADQEMESNPVEDLTAAINILDDVYRQAGDWYGDAVRRCLYCDFDQRNTSLEESAMRESVFQGVMLPLRDHLNALYGGQLDETILF